MSRVLKFRVFDQDAGEMVYGVGLDPDGIAYTPGEYEVAYEADFYLDGRPEQFTGLQDRNGKDIYEGDIVKMHIHISNAFPDTGPKPDNTSIVEFRESGWWWLPTHPELHHEDDQGGHPFYRNEYEGFWDLKYFEVVGNVWENTELLRNEDQPK